MPSKADLQGQTLGLRAAEPRVSRGHALDQALGLRDMRDFQISRNDRPVVQQAPENRLLDLDCADPFEPHRRGATPQRPVHDKQLLRRQDHPRPLPAPDRANCKNGSDRQQPRPGDRRGPADGHRVTARNGERNGAQKRTDEHDPVPPLVDTDPLTVRSDQGVAGFAVRGRIPRS